MSVLFVILLLTLLPLMAEGSRLMNMDRLHHRKCDDIKIDLCKGIGYNETSMPNFAGHEMQQDADLLIQSFLPLIQYGCSSQLRFFLCATLTPMCNDKVPVNIGPCRPVCETVRDRCSPIILEFGYVWPTSLNCSQFPPSNNHHHMCMEGPGEEKSVAPPPLTSVNTSRPSSASSSNPTGVSSVDIKKEQQASAVKTPSSTTSSLCSSFKHSSQFYYINRTEQCSQQCSADILFSQENKDFAENWLLIWCLICLLTTFFTILTFATGSSSFKYPERIIVMMSITYFMYCTGYMIRLMFGREEVSCHLDSQHNVSLLITEGPDNFLCTIVFVLLYYFGMACNVWWVILTIAWFMSSGLNLSPEGIERKSSLFHLLAWMIPALKTLAILIMRSVDADELTGTCFVGNHSKATLLMFVILPSLVYLLTGLFFLSALLHCHYLSSRVRQDCHQSTSSGSQHLHVSSHTLSHVKTTSLTSCCQPKDNHQLLNLRIGFYAVFYLLLSVCLLGENIYEYFLRDSWFTSGSPEMPNVEFFTIKLFLSLVIGIKTGCWIWSSKSSLRIWSKTYSRVSGTSTKSKPCPHIMTPSSHLMNPLLSHHLHPPVTPSTSILSSVPADYFPPPPPPPSETSSSTASSTHFSPVIFPSTTTRSYHLEQQRTNFSIYDNRIRIGGETTV